MDAESTRLCGFKNFSMKVVQNKALVIDLGQQVPRIRKKGEFT